jgi:hypothetical protein
VTLEAGAEEAVLARLHEGRETIDESAFLGVEPAIVAQLAKEEDPRRREGQGQTPTLRGSGRRWYSIAQVGVKPSFL